MVIVGETGTQLPPLGIYPLAQVYSHLVAVVQLETAEREMFPSRPASSPLQRLALVGMVPVQE